MIPRLHVLTDTRPGRDALALVQVALDAGAPCVQVRVKGGTDAELYAFSDLVARRCRAAGALCLVNDRADVARAVGAGGVHLGEHDLPVDAARRVLGEDAEIGGTAREPGRAAALVAQGATYLGVGPAYPTTTKQGLPDALGPAGIAAVARAVDVPVLAIGAVTAARVPELLAAGAHGVAVVAAVSHAPDPALAVRALLAALS